MALGDVIARLSVSLGLETAAFEKGSKRAETRMSGFEKNMSRASGAVKTAFVGMLGVFAVDQILSVAKAGLEYASSLGEVATQLGVTTKSLQEYRYAASQAGVEQGEMDQALSQLTRRLGDAAQGSKSIQAAFDKLGVSVRDSNGHVRDAGDVIPLIAEGLQKVESPAERAAILVDLFGKAGQKLAPLLEGGAAGVNNLRDAAHKLGVVLDDGVIQDADDAADKLSAMKQVMEAKIAGFVASNIEQITNLADKLFRLADAALKAADAWAKWVGGEGPGGRIAQERNAKIKDPGFTNGIATRRSASTVPMTTRIVPLTTIYGETFTGTKRMRLPKGGRGGGGGANAIGASAFGGTDWSQFTPGQGEGFIRMSEAVKGMVVPLQAVDTLTARINVAVGAQMVQNFQAAAQGALDMAGAAQTVMDRLFPVDARRRQYIDELALLRSQYDGTTASAARLAEAERLLRNEWVMSLPAVDSLKKGLGEYMKASDQAAATAEQTTQRIGTSYASLAANIGGVIANLIGGKTGRIIGGIIQIAGTAAAAFGGARAAGGPVTGGRAYLVGEKGPELMVPGRSGVVVPNHAIPQLVASPAGGRIVPNNGGSAVTRVEIVDTTGLFVTKVNGQIMQAAPSIARAGAAGGIAEMRRSQQRRFA